MSALPNVSYPTHLFKPVIQAFTSPDIPKRPESVKEMSSIGYHYEEGSHAVFMFDVPDDQLAQLLDIQSRRSAFISGRVPGFISTLRVGENQPRFRCGRRVSSALNRDRSRIRAIFESRR